MPAPSRVPTSVQNSSATSGQRLPFGAIEYVLKSGEKLENPPFVSAGGGSYTEAELRCRSFIHANPVNQRHCYGEATERAKAMDQYVVHVTDGTGSGLNPDFELSTNRAYLGSAISQGGGDYTGQTRVTTTELPVVPITSLASLMHFKLSPGIVSAASAGHSWDVSPNQMLGIGNSFSHPLIPANAVYQGNPDLAKTSGGPQFMMERDVYDHAYFNNDALWDTWFCSGMTRKKTAVSFFDQASGLDKVVGDFIGGVAPLANARLRLWNDGLSNDLIKSKLVSGTQPATDSWKQAAAHLMLDGAFNVNSTSVAAWKAFLWGLRDTKINYVDPDSGNIRQASVPGDRVVLSRFTLPVSGEEGADAGDPDSWLGVRFLTAAQVEKLAEECVRQVKLRGPFLNMADFINRRVENSDLGQVGALQAAIDWDEWNGNSPRPGGADSVNGRFKNTNDLIGLADVSYRSNNAIFGGNPALPNPKAATGVGGGVNIGWNGWFENRMGGHG